MSANIYLTHLGIKTFNECKRCFKNKYINKIPSGKHGINKYIAFDISLHSTLAEFNKLYLADDKSLDSLISLLDKNWVSKGYDSNIEEQHFKQRAVTTLKSYYYNPLDIGIENLIVNKKLQKNLGSNLILRGKVDKFQELNGGLFELVDYKTGKYLPPTFHIKFNSHLAILLTLIYSSYGIYPDLVSYYYLMHNRKFTIEIDNNSIQFAKDYLDFITSQIEQEERYDCCKYPCSKIDCKYFNLCSKKFQNN